MEEPRPGGPRQDGYRRVARSLVFAFSDFQRLEDQRRKTSTPVKRVRTERATVSEKIVVKKGKEGTIAGQALSDGEQAELNAFVASKFPDLMNVDSEGKNCTL